MKPVIERSVGRRELGAKRWRSQVQWRQVQILAGAGRLALTPR